MKRPGSEGLICWGGVEMTATSQQGKEYFGRLAWYDAGKAGGWILVQVSMVLDGRVHLRALGGGLSFDVPSYALRTFDMSTVRPQPPVVRDGHRYEPYIVAPDPRFGGPYYWVLLQEGYESDGSEPTEEEGLRRIAAVVDELEARRRAISPVG